MHRVTRLALSALALAITTGALATTASAAECPGAGEGLTLCSGGHVLQGTFALSGKSSGIKTVTIDTIMTIQCSKGSSSGQLVATATSVKITKDVLEWSGCQVSGRPSCKVKPITVGIGAGLNGALSLSGETGEATFGAVEEQLPVAEVSVTGCEQEYEGKITGTQKCKLGKITTEKTAHALSCSGAESHLKLRTRVVSLEFNEELEVGGKLYSLQHA